MALEIILKVEARYSHRCMIGDGRIVEVVEDGQTRKPRNDSFRFAIAFLKDSDFEPAGQPVQIGRAGYFKTYKYTYRKPGVYVQSEHGQWAAAYPVEGGWKVRKKGEQVETFYRTRHEALKAVDNHVGVNQDYLEQLRKEGMVGEKGSVKSRRGRPPISPNAQTVAISITVTQKHLDFLRRYGFGNVSLGVRRLVNEAKAGRIDSKAG